MTLHPTQAQVHADAIKRRRQAVADLRFIAQLIDDGLPIPLGIHNWRDGLRLSIAAADVADWLLALDLPMPTWERRDSEGGEFFEATCTHLGTSITVAAFRRATTEVTC